MSGFEHIESYYGLNLRRGVRVTQYEGRSGRILSASEGKLWLQMDDTGRREGPYHPTWEMTYHA